MFFSSIYWNFLKQNTISTFFEALNRYNHQNSQDIPPPPSFPLVISKVVLGLATATTHFQQNALFPTFCIFSLISPFSHSAVDEIVEIFSQKAGKHFKTSCRFSFYLFTSLQIDNTSVFQYSSIMVMWLFFPKPCIFVAAFTQSAVSIREGLKEWIFKMAFAIRRRPPPP